MATATTAPDPRGLEDERDRLARLSRKGIGVPAAGLAYWLVVAVLVRVLPQETALLASFFLTLGIWPLGAALTRALGGDLFARSEALAPLGLLLAGIQLFHWPVIVVVFRTAPEWTPFTLAVLFGSHFLTWAWLYRSRAHALLAGVTTVVLCVAVLVLRSPLYFEAPVLAALCHAGAFLLLFDEVNRMAPAA